MKKFLKYLINYDFWESYKTERKLKDALKIYFKEESADLQKLFLKNFSYPQNMTEKPVRLNDETGQIYYVINFTDKELFFNEATLQSAFAQSISILQTQLPLGLTNYLVPEIVGRIEESYSILITLTPMYSNIGPVKILKSLLKPFIILLAIAIILISIVYV